MSYNVAIDGPAGAGKSTIARQVAKKEGFIYVDTGAMYRAMAYYMLQQGIDGGDSAAISKSCADADITLRYENGEQVVLLNGENVNGVIRTEEVSRMASVTSANPDVRVRLVQLQQKLAAANDVVMDGRDIGTCVLPNADVKVFLTASASVRANRRFLELQAKGETADLATIEADIIERDHRDMTREHSPLKQADDAVLLDSSDMTIEQVVETIMQMIEKSKKERNS